MSFFQRFKALRQQRWFSLVTDVVLVVGLILGISAWQTRGHVEGPAPDFNRPTLGGGTLALSQLKGKPSMVVFWAPWCGVCQQESSNISRVRRWVGEKANVVSVASAWGDLNEVQAYAQRNAVDYPVVLDNIGIAEAFKVNAYPTIYFLNAEGQVTGSVVGYSTTVGLLARLLL